MKKGFTLIELMVVIAIAAVMMGAVSVGFASFFHTISVQNAPGQIGDILDQLSRETITRDYKKSSVFFESEYLLADSVGAEAALLLKRSVGGCPGQRFQLKGGKDAWLFITDPSGDPVDEPRFLAAGTPLCFDPLGYREREVICELKSDDGFSNKIRVFPLNLNLNPSDDIQIETNNYRLDILQPYGKKERYENDTLMNEADSAELTVKSKEGDAEAAYELPKS